MNRDSLRELADVIELAPHHVGEPDGGSGVWDGAPLLGFNIDPLAEGRVVAGLRAGRREADGRFRIRQMGGGRRERAGRDV